MLFLRSSIVWSIAVCAAVCCDSKVETSVFVPERMTEL